ncbi:CoA transferase [Sphingomonas metalli]|uniref:CoA transferase n=1 Tax=Sphingomonas metalli TaxID=1779358 RepID=A0A916T173_9SPHN|nr:CaiB/BaiF CoA-transferase family protein [Sphingomonas metalli]GGB27423.1 CoA transferase [Sphingomonas metalli]
MTGPLSGLRVLDFTRFLPGAYTGWIAGDMGADVIRVENPRELAKHARMFGHDPDDAGDAARLRRARPSYWRNRRSIVLDPGHPAARPLLETLVASADILVEDYRPGVMAAMGLGQPALAAINPRLIYASVSFAGQDGPLAGRAGHDPAALALAGALSRLNGLPQPSLPGVQVADVLAGAHAAIAVLVALQERERTGFGRHVDVAMTDAAMPLIAVALGRAAPDDIPPPDGGWHPKGGVWECGDGLWLCTTDMEPRYWQRFCAAVDRPDYAARQFDTEAHPAIEADLRALFRTRPRAAWLALLEAADTQAMPVLTPAEALRHPHAEARGMHVTLPVGTGTVEQIGTPFRLSGAAPPEHRPAGLPGAERDAILGELGFDAEAIAALAAAGAFSGVREASA